MMQDMPATARRRFLGGVALGAATFAAGRTIAAPAGDAHASGYHRLMAAKPFRSFPGGTLHLASAREFPVSASMTGLVTRLQPGAMQELHWHPNANEWFYVSKGRARATLFGADKRMAVAELGIGDCGYFPQGWGHSIEAVGTEKCEIVAALDSGTYQDSSLSEWIAKVPPVAQDRQRAGAASLRQVTGWQINAAASLPTMTFDTAAVRGVVIRTRQLRG
jgi:oxalate decarboxylase/phosphoglucose isomerase-like protein (cupin superfamily)